MIRVVINGQHCMDTQNLLSYVQIFKKKYHGNIRASMSMKEQSDWFTGG